MKLNPDLIRDILLTVEEKCDFDNPMIYDSENNTLELLKPYTHEEIIYHINQCELAQLILGVNFYSNRSVIHIKDLTPAGHEFLANIRKDNIWNNTKAVAEEIGTRSLTALTQISANVVTSIIKSKFGLL